MATGEENDHAGRSLAKDFHRLMKNIDSLSGGQARVAEWNESDLEGGITVAVVPDSGPYKDGEFMFEISCNTGYPRWPPDVTCLTYTYHPNIHLHKTGGEVCLSMLNGGWSFSMTLEDVVQGILFLLHNPNLEDPLNSVFRSMDEEEFAKNVRQSLDGGWLGKYHFERNRVTRGKDGKIVSGTAPEGWSLAKDFHRLLKNIDSFSGGQARVDDWDESDLKDGSICVAVVPDSGPYKDGEFKFLICCNGGYPDSPPRVYCITQIYHPNIEFDESDNTSAEMCLSTLSSDWLPTMTLDDVVQAILFVLHNPNINDPISSLFHQLPVNEEEFAKNVELSLDGGWLDDHYFKRNRVTRRGDGEIVKDGKSPDEAAAAVRREEQPSKTVGEEDAGPVDAPAENKTTDGRKKAESEEKTRGDTGVESVD